MDFLIEQGVPVYSQSVNSGATSAHRGGLTVVGGCNHCYPDRRRLGALGTLLSAASIRAISSGVLNGLVTKSSAPASRAATLSSSELRTVRIMMAISVSFRIALLVARPPIPGMSYRALRGPAGTPFGHGIAAVQQVDDKAAVVLGNGVSLQIARKDIVLNKQNMGRQSEAKSQVCGVESDPTDRRAGARLIRNARHPVVLSGHHAARPRRGQRTHPATLSPS